MNPILLSIADLNQIAIEKIERSQTVESLCKLETEYLDETICCEESNSARLPRNHPAFTVLTFSEPRQTAIVEINAAN